MSVSGVKLAAEALNAYEAFKKQKSCVAFLIFNVVKSDIVVEEEVLDEQVPALLAQAKAEGFNQTATEPDKYALLRSRLLKSGPRYATILLKHTKSGETRGSEKVTYIMWCKDDSAVRQRMLISTSKDAIVKKLVGLHIKCEANDESEIQYEHVLGL